MHSNHIRYGSAALALVACVAVLSCFQRDNPMDPGSENYDPSMAARAGDRTAPTLSLFLPESSAVDIDTIRVRGTVGDNGEVSQVTVSGAAVAISNGDFSHLVTLQLGLNSITVLAVDNALTPNQTSRTVKVFRLSQPSAPSDLAVSAQGAGVAVSWADNSGNELWFRIYRSDSTNTQYRVIDSVAAGQVAFVDNGPFRNGLKYYYKVSAVNGSGESALSAHDVITYSATASDVTGPIVEVLYPQASAVLPLDTIEVSVAATDSSGVTLVTINGGVAVRSGSGQWVRGVRLAVGSNTITVVATDNSPNANTTTRTVSVTHDPGASDADGPTIRFSSPLDGGTVSSATVVVQLLVTDVSGVQSVKVASSTASLISGGTASGTYSVSLTMGAVGAQVLPVEAVDTKGNRRYDTLNLVYNPSVVDSVGPVLTVTTPQNSQRFRERIVQVTGTATDGQSGIDRITVNDVPATYVAGSGTFTCVVAVGHGATTLSVVAEDASTLHNKTTVQVSVVQNKPPEFVSQPADTSISIGGGTDYAREMIALDPDSDAITFVMLQTNWHCGDVPVLNGRRVNSYLPTTAGSDTFIVVAKDAFTEFDTARWIVTVQPQSGGNLPPFFQTNAAAMSAQVTVPNTYQDTVFAVDQDGDSLWLAEFGLPASMNARMVRRDATTFMIYLDWVPTAAQAGTYYPSMVVTDGNGGRDTLGWSIQVDAPPAAPVSWYQVGSAVPGGYAWSIAASPSGMVFVGNQDGVYKYVNGSWSQLQISGFAPVDVLHYGVEGRLYAGSRQVAALMVTTDDGISWVRDTTVSGYVKSITPFPPDAQPSVAIGTSNGVFRQQAQGNPFYAWSEGVMQVQPERLAVDPVRRLVYAANSNNNMLLYRGFDDTAWNWCQSSYINGGLYEAGLVIGANGTVFVSLRQGAQTIQKSNTACGQWEGVTMPTSTQIPNDLLYQPARGYLFVGYRDGSCYLSKDEGLTWFGINTGNASVLERFTMAADSAQTVYCVHADGSVFKAVNQ